MNNFKFSSLWKEESSAAQQAKQQGLTHVGWGRYADKTGRVVAKSVNGRLQSVTASSNKQNQQHNNEPTGLPSSYHNFVKKIDNKLFNMEKTIEKLGQLHPNGLSVSEFEKYTGISKKEITLYSKYKDIVNPYEGFVWYEPTNDMVYIGDPLSV